MSRGDASRRETDDRHELESLVNAAMEQRLDADGFRRLDELVGSDVSLAHACVEQLDLQSAMVEFAEDVRPDDTIRKVIGGSRSSKRPTQGVRRQTLTVALSLATALALAAVCVPLVVIGSRATPVATVEALSERADVEGAAFGVGSILNRGARSRIEAGVATFRTESGVVLDVRGPAIVAWRGADRVELINGTLRASVPPSGVGFTVVTERAEIVDLGTEFVVGHRLTEETHVGVLSGRVDTYVWDAGRERTRK
ncbi:MAG: FecR domain-containing protein, partial [Planctomycetota bacterium]